MMKLTAHAKIHFDDSCKTAAFHDLTVLFFVENWLFT